jgi:hypothetical protein
VSHRTARREGKSKAVHLTIEVVRYDHVLAGRRFLYSGRTLKQDSLPSPPIATNDNAKKRISGTPAETASATALPDVCQR